MNHRHRSRTATIVFLLCLPLALIAYFTFTFLNEKLNADEIKAVMISHEGSDSVDYSDRESIVFYTELFLGSSKLAEPLRETEESSAVTVKLDRGDSVMNYRIYPELSETGCMFTDPRGNYYLIPKESARAMLSREEFSYLYVASALPELKIISGSLEKEILPVSYGWYYKKQDGEYAEYTEKETATSTEQGRIYANRSNSMLFSRKPDELSISMVDETGAILTQSDIDSLVFGKDMHIRVTVNATWLRTGAGNCNGTASYDFDLLYDIPPTISLSSPDVAIGGCVVINMRFLNEDEKVTLSSELNLGELHFTENEGVMTAVLGVADTNRPGRYDVVYTVGDNSGSFELNVVGKAQDERTDIQRMNVSDELYEKALSGAAKAELYGIVDEAYSMIGDKTYSVLGFSRPVSSGKLAQSYGTKIIANINNTTDTQLIYAIGNTYSVSRESGVYASAKGKIIYTGSCGTLGNLVIIDHGCGVCSWYYGLETIERGVGTEVGPSTKLGTAGVNQYDNTPSVGFCVTAGKVFVDPIPE